MSMPTNPVVGRYYTNSRERAITYAKDAIRDGWFATVWNEGPGGVFAPTGDWVVRISHADR